MKKFYPNIHSVQVKVGLFTILIILLLILGNLWLSNRISTRSLQDLRVLFEDVAGLEVGDKVMYRGMEVGRIKSIENSPGGILVKARIHKEIRLPQGTVFQVADSSLMGGKTLSIIPGADADWLNLEQVQAGQDPGGIMSIISKAGSAMRELENIIADIRKENGVISKGAGLIDDAGSAIRSVDLAAGELSAQLSHSLGRFNELSGRIDTLVKSNADSLNKSISDAPATFRQLQATLDSLKTLGGELNRSTALLNSGAGTAGKLMTDEQLYLRLLQSVENLDALVKDVKENPKKYVKFSIF